MSRPRASFAGLVMGEAERAVRLRVPSEEAHRAEALARERGWLESDGANWPLLVVAFGVAVLRQEAEQTSTAADGDQETRLRQRWMRLDGRASALRFAAFELARTNRILEIRENALRIDNRGMRLRLGEEAP